MPHAYTLLYNFEFKMTIESSNQALLAQWIARWTSNPKVVGSSPTQGNFSISKSHFRHLKISWHRRIRPSTLIGKYWKTQPKFLFLGW